MYLHCLNIYDNNIMTSSLMMNDILCTTVYCYIGLNLSIFFRNKFVFENVLLLIFFLIIYHFVTCTAEYDTNLIIILFQFWLICYYTIFKWWSSWSFIQLSYFIPFMVKKEHLYFKKKICTFIHTKFESFYMGIYLIL